MMIPNRISTRFAYISLDEIHTHTSHLVEIHTHNHHIIIIEIHIMQHTSRPVNAIGYTITYQTPYNHCEWRTQSFTTLDEAQRMIEFYKSCGSPAELVTW
jgi:hypothetical protein